MIGADNGFFPGRRPAIFWTNAEMLFIRTLGTNFSEILRCSYVFIQENSIQIVVYKMAAIFSQSQCIKELTKFLKTRSYISFIISHLLWYIHVYSKNKYLSAWHEQLYHLVRHSHLEDWGHCQAAQHHRAGHCVLWLCYATQHSTQWPGTLLLAASAFRHGCNWISSS